MFDLIIKDYDNAKDLRDGIEYMTGGDSDYEVKEIKEFVLRGGSRGSL